VLPTPKGVIRSTLFSLVLILVLMAVACAPVPPVGNRAAESGAAESADTDQVTITWGFWGSPAEKNTHEAVAEAFMLENPDINIEIWHQPWGDYFTNLQTLWAAGNAAAIPDVLFLSPITTYASDGVLENLDPYIEESGHDLDDYWPGLIESATYEGHIYGLPRDIGLEVLYYNKDIFDEVGVDYPTAEWTWSDFLEALEALTVVESSGRVARYGLGMEGGKYQLWIAQNDGALFDDVHAPTECTMDEPAAMEAIQLFADMMNNNWAMRPVNLSQAGGDVAVFQSGQVAMIIQNASRISAFNEAGLNYDVSVVPIPEGGQRGANAAGAAWTMSSRSDNKDAAWTFLRWLQSTDGGQRIYTGSGEILPARQSTAKSDAFVGMEQPPANRAAFIIEGENASQGRTLLIPEWNELRDTIINPTVEKIWAGTVMPEDVLPQLCDDADAFLAANGYGQ